MPSHKKSHKTAGKGGGGTALKADLGRNYTKLKGGSAPSTASLYQKAGANKTSMK